MQDSSTAILDAMAGQRYEEALSLAYAQLDRDPRDQFGHQVVARLRQMAGDDAGAREQLRDSAGRDDAIAPLLAEYGAVCARLGDVPAATDAYRRAVALEPAETAYLQNLTALFLRAERWRDAVPALRTLRDRNPADDEVEVALRDAQSRIVPVWHFAMMNDVDRNTRYDVAITEAVRGKHVLEIGTGAGLLAMCAARAGAASVVTCEMETLVAEAAQEIVAHNQLSSTVRVIPKASHDLKLGVDLDRKAEILVTEIFSSDLLAENVLPALRHARTALLAKDAQVIPAAASAMGRLVGGTALRDKVWAVDALGFDVTPFGRFAPRRIGLDLSQQPHLGLSEPVELLRLDFATDLDQQQARDVTFVATEDELCVGVAQWIRLELSPGNIYENDPLQTASCWQHVLYCLPAPVAVRRGDTMRVRITHDDRAILLRFDPA